MSAANFKWEDVASERPWKPYGAGFLVDIGEGQPASE